MTISTTTKNYMQQTASLVVLSLLLVGAQSLWAWTEPSVAPPNGNVDPPINTSTSPQTKKGALVVNGTASAAIGLLVPDGRIEVGDRAGATVPGDVGLGIFGKKFRLMDGTEGAGKVLTSNANGLARWESSTQHSTFMQRGTATVWADDWTSVTLPESFTDTSSFIVTAYLKRTGSCGADSCYALIPLSYPSNWAFRDDWGSNGELEIRHVAGNKFVMKAICTVINGGDCSQMVGFKRLGNRPWTVEWVAVGN